jgi:hypothetical protein
VAESHLHEDTVYIRPAIGGGPPPSILMMGQQLITPQWIIRKLRTADRMLAQRRGQRGGREGALAPPPNWTSVRSEGLKRKVFPPAFRRVEHRLSGFVGTRRGRVDDYVVDLIGAGNLVPFTLKLIC